MKPGIRSTEFWLTTTITIVLIIAAVADSIKDILPEGFVPIAMSIAAAGYAISRGLAKINILIQTGEARNDKPDSTANPSA